MEVSKALAAVQDGILTSLFDHKYYSHVCQKWTFWKVFTHLRDNDFDQEFPILMTNLALRVMFDSTDNFKKLKNFKNNQVF